MFLWCKVPWIRVDTWLLGLHYPVTIVSYCCYNKLSGLKQQKAFITLQFYRWEIWVGSHRAKSRWQQGCVTFWRFQGRICFFTFPFLGSWTPSIFKASNGQLSLSHITPLAHTRVALFHLQAPLDYNGSNQITQDSPHFSVSWFEQI